MFSKPSPNQYLRKPVAMHVLVILLAALLIANVTFGNAWAKGHEKEGKRGDDKKESKEKSDKDESKADEKRGKGEKQEKNEDNSKEKSDDKEDKNESKTKEENDNDDDDDKNDDKSKDQQDKRSDKSESQSKDGSQDNNENNEPEEQNKSSNGPPDNARSAASASGPDSGEPATPQQPPLQEPPILPPAKVEVSVEDSLHAADSTGTLSGFGRSISESVNLEEASLLQTVVPLSIPLDSTFQPTEVPPVSIPSATAEEPIITVTSSRVMHIAGDQEAEITFESNVDGRYSILVQSDGGESVQTLAGQLFEGANSVLWNGKDAADESVPSGEYRYFILAEGAGGLRQPPSAGDGIIVVQASPAVPISTTAIVVLAIVLAAIAAGVAILLFRRRGSITMFVPARAADFVDDVRRRYPKAMVANHAESNDDMDESYFEITVPKGADMDWLVEIAEQAKAMAKAE